MAHELDITDSIASFASAREHAWHRMGQVLPGKMTTTEALEAAHLARWNVRKLPLYIPNEGAGEQELVPIPDKYATVRTNPINGGTDYLGVVGTDFTPIQNEEHADLMDALVDESGAHIETAGALRGGRSTFLSMKLPEAMEFDGQNGKDRTDLYIAALNFHDGTGAFKFIVTPVRIVCANTQSAALSSAKASFSIRHTAGATRAVAEAREALGLTWKYLEAFQQEAQKMINREIRERDARIVLRKVFHFEEAKTDRAKENKEGIVSNVIKLWSDAETNAAFRGSRWGLYNAVTEYFDHYIPIPGKDGVDAETVRAERITRGAWPVAYKEKAFKLLSTPSR